MLMDEEEIRKALLELDELASKAHPDSDAFYYEFKAGRPYLKEFEEKKKLLEEKLPGFKIELYAGRFGILPKTDREIQRELERLKKSQENHG